MPLPTILGVTIAYVLIAILLLSLNLTSRWRWWIKGGAIVVTTLFFIGTYVAMTAVLGWPAYTSYPPRFSLLHTKVIEPDKFTGVTGQIFVWVEELDENNIPREKPRAFQLPYSDALAEQLRGAQNKLDSGEGVMGELQGDPAEEEGAEREQANADERDLQLQQQANQRDDGAAAADAQPFLEIDPMRFAFTELPPPIMPDKGPQ